MTTPTLAKRVSKEKPIRPTTKPQRATIHSTGEGVGNKEKIVKASRLGVLQ